MGGSRGFVEKALWLLSFLLEFLVGRVSPKKIQGSPSVVSVAPMEITIMDNGRNIFKLDELV
jgi:hypothetical protein